MRTKTLLMTAALSAAGILASNAQVYSVNAVGYINLDLPVGFSIIANQLNNGDNKLDTLLKDAGFGDTVYKFVPGTGPTAGFTQSSQYLGSWTPNLELKPGEAAFIQLGAAKKFTLVGEVPQGTLTQTIPAGFSLQSSQVPQSANLDGPSPAGMGFPADFGDTIYYFRLNTTTQKREYVQDQYLGSFTLKPAVGEGFFVNKGTAATWTRTFSVN